MLACVVLAHTDPVHVRRLIEALDPFPVFLHCDARSTDEVWTEMTRELPARCVPLPRLATPWARWPVVAAELSGYRAVLQQAPEATHLAVLTGSDYPLAASDRISEALAAHAHNSMLFVKPLPYKHWGASGGFSRLRYPHSSIGRRIIRMPIPRSLPAGVRFAGGAQQKILARHHVESVLQVVDTRTDLVKFWQRTWVPDETFVPSILNTPTFVADWATNHVQSDAWYINWNSPKQKSPPWLGTADLPALRVAAMGATTQLPRLFARKFSTDHNTVVLDTLDAFRQE